MRRCFILWGDLGSHRWLRREQWGRGGTRGGLGTGMLEEGEVDGTVGAELLEEGMGGEIGGFAVLEDEDAIGSEPTWTEDEVGELVEIGEVVGRVGEDEVEGRRGGSVEVAEDIASDELVAGAGDVELGGDLLDELLLGVPHFDTYDMGGATAEQFETDAARATEKVERSATLEIDAILEDVEESLLCQVGGGPGVEVAWRVEAASAVLAGDYFQINN